MDKNNSNITESNTSKKNNSKSNKSKSNTPKSNVSESADNKKGLHDGHRERMRKRFREAKGFDGFEEHQILEMILFYAIPRRDTNEMAHLLINRFGNIAKVMNASYDELMEFSFINENAATLLKMLPSLISVYYNANSSGIIYDDTQKMHKLFEPYFAGLDHEELRVACFTPELELITNECVCSGTLTEASVDIRKLMAIVIKSNSSNIVIAHNHPKGDPTPSPQDIRLTKDITKAMKTIGVTLLDHVIVGERRTISLKDTPYMSFLN